MWSQERSGCMEITHRISPGSYSGSWQWGWEEQLDLGAGFSGRVGRSSDEGCRSE